MCASVWRVRGGNLLHTGTQAPERRPCTVESRFSRSHNSLVVSVRDVMCPASWLLFGCKHSPNHIRESLHIRQRDERAWQDVSRFRCTSNYTYTQAHAYEQSILCPFASCCSQQQLCRSAIPLQPRLVAEASSGGLPGVAVVDMLLVVSAEIPK